MRQPCDLPISRASPAARRLSARSTGERLGRAAYNRPDGKRDVYRAWDKRKDPARIWDVLDEVESKYLIVRTRTALLGFSAGCKMGWILLADRPQAFCFFGGVANGFVGGKPPVSEAALRRAAHFVPHFYGVGKNDPFAGPMFQRTASMLRAEGFELRTVHPAGVGHDLPPAIKTPLLAFLDEVYARQKRMQVQRRASLLLNRKTPPRSRFFAFAVFGVALLSVAGILILVRRHSLR